MMSLSDAYAEVPPAILGTKSVFVPESDMQLTPWPVEAVLPAAMEQETQWLEHVRRMLDKEKLDKGDYVSWAAYHASHQPQILHAITLNALLPLLYESAHTVAMVKHGMDVIRKATQYFNPGQS